MGGGGALEKRHTVEVLKFRPVSVTRVGPRTSPTVGLIPQRESTVVSYFTRTCRGLTWSNAGVGGVREGR